MLNYALSAQDAYADSHETLQGRAHVQCGNVDGKHKVGSRRDPAKLLCSIQGYAHRVTGEEAPSRLSTYLLF